jgi:hypothetical protein
MRDAWRRHTQRRKATHAEGLWPATDDRSVPVRAEALSGPRKRGAGLSTAGVRSLGVAALTHDVVRD